MLRGLNIALMVDRVIGVKQLPITIFEEKSSIIETSIDYQYIRAIGVINEESYILLDLMASRAMMFSMSFMQKRWYSTMGIIPWLSFLVICFIRLWKKLPGRRGR